MLEKIESSIIIPVHNQWKFTCDCLVALKKTLEGKSCEIIIIDNASADKTVTACPALGAQLFGEFFHYERFDSNRNFGPASNYGASIAKGEYLVFLNNDTVPLEGWYEPLVDDFSKFPDIAATGPLLVYPECAPFGHQIQHLGVFVTPTLKVGHLYEGIPANSLLAQKRRFFQIITAACMMIRRSQFNQIGRFDERFINGFEDVDLCARLWNAGYRMTVNPEARVVHHASQTPGRNKYETKNFQLLRLENLKLLTPDWHIHLAKDDLLLRLSPWQTLQGSLPVNDLEKLGIVVRQASVEELQKVLSRYPLWQEGYLALIDRLHRQGLPTHNLCMAACKLWPEPRILFAAYQYALAERNARRLSFCMELMLRFCTNFEEYVMHAHMGAAWAKDIGLHDLEREHHNWLANRESFYSDHYAPFVKQMLEWTQNIPFYPNCDWAYALWRNNQPLPTPRPNQADALRTHEGEIAFSILMPVYNPKPEHLIQAINSIFAQGYPHWELCLAEDASTDPEIGNLIETIAAKDSRIRVTYRKKNGNIAAATNTALAMAEKRYVALMDQDDLITPDALEVAACYIAENPDAALFFSDEDKVTDGGKFFCPHFKNSKWDWELFHGQNFVNHLGVYRADRLREVGGFRDAFSGAQDYDMLLHYTRDLTTDKIVHIPQILYHWRAHAGSTATNVSIKSEAVESSRRALQEKMSETYPGSVVTQVSGRQHLQVQYPLPANRPLVSLVLDIGTEFPFVKSKIKKLRAKTNYTKIELLLLYSEDAPQQHIHRLISWAKTERHLVLLPYNNGQASLAQRHNIALQKAGGSVVGFLANGVIPLTQNWLEHILGLLCRDNVGVVAGKLVCMDNTILHGGYLVDATGKLGCAFSGLPKDNPGYFAWNMQVRTVDAVDAFCFFTHHHLLQSTGTFDASLPDTATQDYCLRLVRDGFRSVWTPFVEFLLTLPDSLPRISGRYIDDSLFCTRWDGKIQPCNPRLTLTAGGWELNKSILERPSTIRRPCGNTHIESF